MAENLVTLEEMKAAKGLGKNDIDEARDLRYEESIGMASDAVRTYCDRSFGLPVVEGKRVFEYESYGFVDIDDAQEIKEVVFVFGENKTPITEFYWRAMPKAGPPFYYLTVPHWAGIYSPEMGFTYNLDVISKDRGWPGLIPVVEVTAKWGWGEKITRDIKRAVILTAYEFADIPDNFVSESVAGYSYATAIRTAGQPGGDSSNLIPTAIPGRAQDLLEPYVRFQI